MDVKLVIDDDLRELIGGLTTALYTVAEVGRDVVRALAARRGGTVDGAEPVRGAEPTPLRPEDRARAASQERHPAGKRRTAP